MSKEAKPTMRRDYTAPIHPRVYANWSAERRETEVITRARAYCDRHGLSWWQHRDRAIREVFQSDWALELAPELDQVKTWKQAERVVARALRCFCYNNPDYDEMRDHKEIQRLVFPTIPEQILNLYLTPHKFNTASEEAAALLARLRAKGLGALARRAANRAAQIPGATLRDAVKVEAGNMISELAHERAVANLVDVVAAQKEILAENPALQEAWSRGDV